MTQKVNIAAAEKAAKPFAAQTTDWLGGMQSMELSNLADVKFAVQATAEVKEKIIEVDTQRKKFTDAAQAIIDEANGFFKPVINDLKECEKVLKLKLVSRDNLLAGERILLIEKAGEVAQEGGDPLETQALLEAADERLPEKVKGLSISRSLGVEITSSKEFIQWCINHDRLELITPNEKALKALAKAAGDNLPDIEGVRFVPKASVSVTASKVERS